MRGELRSNLMRAVAGMLLALPFAAGLAAGAQEPSSQSKAKSEAAKQLSELMLPAGATRVTNDPSKGLVLRRPFVPATNRRYVIDDYRYWRVPGGPSEVASWIRSHPPAGAQQWFGVGRTPSGAHEFGWLFRYPSEAEVVLQRLYVQVAPAVGGGTAVRGDGVAVWVPPHPAWDQVPGSAHVMTVWRTLRGKHSGPITFRDRRDVRRVIRFLDHAAVVPPIIEHCAPPSSGSFKVIFQAHRPGQVLARSHGPIGCGSTTLSVRGRRGPALVGAYQLQRILDRMIRRRQ